MSTRVKFASLAGSAALALAGTVGLSLVVSSNVLAASKVDLLETGSTLLYPLFNIWVPDYQKAHTDVQITTQGTGSGTGISQAISGIAQIGASDAYMSDAQIKAHADILNIPLAISSQMINYNIPGLNDQHLKLSGPVLAGIYDGKITFWDDAAIAKLNSGVKLPHKVIVPVHRTDGSGDTFIFTQYLSFSTPDWSKSAGYGTTVSWPAVQGGIGAEGNPGMVNATKGTPYSISYIGISFKNATDQASLGEAQLENKDGKFVMPDSATVSAAVDQMAGKTPPDERVSLIFAPGPQSYPIINYEYAIVKSDQANGDTADALKQFLDWTISPSGGSAANYMKQVGFVPLPQTIQDLSKKQIDKVHAAAG
jgi:phosphate transport system substrate-binding protein